MTSDERRGLIALIFETVTADESGIQSLRPREGWKPYMRADVPLRGV